MSHPASKNMKSQETLPINQNAPLGVGLHAVVMPRSWNKFKWPRWVPQSVRLTVEDFWSCEYGRNPEEWHKGTVLAPYNNHPNLGDKVTIDTRKFGGHKATGRWVPCWNNIGRVVNRRGCFVAGTCDIVKRHNDELTHRATKP